MAEHLLCRRCRRSAASAALGACGECLKQDPELLAGRAAAAHKKSRAPLPGAVPRAAGGVTCRVCAHRCTIPPGGRGFCGLRENQGGRLVHLAGTAGKGLATWYRDPLPTNCVADWVCPAGSPSGFPRYSYSPSAEIGYFNLAVFFGGCSFDCLFCQNRHYHELAVRLAPLVAPEDLAAAVTPDTSCICFFGGDPSPQVPFALRAAALARARAAGRILRICWETNGNIASHYLHRLAALSLESGGCVKFDLKAYHEGLHRALTGAGNRAVLDNFAALAAYIPERPDPPFLVASTLLIPGYVEVAEVAAIARFIASLDPAIPYTLLAFSPQHLFRDLPLVSRETAEACRAAALEAGLKRVRIGNVHLLR